MRFENEKKHTDEDNDGDEEKGVCVADEDDGEEESAVTPTTRENNGEEGGEGDEDTSSFCGEVLSSDDDEDDNEEEEELDEELEDVHRKWEIVARYPCVLHRVERTKNDANDNDKTSSLLDAWMRRAEKRQTEVKSRQIWPRYRQRSLEGSRRVQFSRGGVSLCWRKRRKNR